MKDRRSITRTRCWTLIGLVAFATMAPPLVCFSQECRRQDDLPAEQHYTYENLDSLRPLASNATYTSTSSTSSTSTSTTTTI